MATTFERDGVVHTMMQHGRSDYRRGVEFRAHAGDAWKAGWIDEAQLRAGAIISAEVTMAMALIDAQRALDAARIAVETCRMDPSRMGKHQRQVMSRTMPLLTDALERLTAAIEATSGKRTVPPKDEAQTAFELRNPAR